MEIASPKACPRFSFFKKMTCARLYRAGAARDRQRRCALVNRQKAALCSGDKGRGPACLALAIIATCFCAPETQASAQSTETIHSCCRFWLSTPDRVRRASNLTMTDLYYLEREEHEEWG
jgi:hypothetical protein